MPFLPDTPEAKRPKAHRASAIVGIQTTRLFGQFDYKMPEPDTDPRCISNVMILYGDNGSGKTTLLNLAFHLLSAANNRSHRNSLAKIPFLRFQVKLSDQTEITLEREKELTGGYRIFVTRAGNPVLSTDFGLKEKCQFGTSEGEEAYIAFLMSLRQTVYFLSADRQIMSDLLPRESEDESLGEVVAYYPPELAAEHGRRLSANLKEVKGRSVKRAISLAADWVRQQAFRAANRGTGSTHTVYADILKRISAYPHSLGGSAPEDIRQEVISTLHSLSRRSSEYAKFGFTGPIQVDDMVSAMNGAAGETVALIESVVRPYIDSANARLDELEGIYNRTATFISNLDSFYADKRVRFDVNRKQALRVERLNSGEELQPEALSSGEQQLLLLFCHALISGDRRSIFMIDEPELSLNIKWQRKLIQALLDLIQGGQVQFIFATHSIELLAEHSEKVVKLKAEPHAREMLTDTVRRAGDSGVSNA